MTYYEHGFRSVYDHFCLFSPHTFPSADRLQGYKDADVVLTYGYIDRNEGVKLIVFCCGTEEDGVYTFLDTEEEQYYSVSMKGLEYTEFSHIDESSADLDIYKLYIEHLPDRKLTEDLKLTRRMRFLDGFRDNIRVDELLVELRINGDVLESCPARLLRSGKDYLLCTLVMEPRHKCGFHAKDNLFVFIEEVEEDEEHLDVLHCYSDLTPYSTGKSDSEKETLIREAIEKYSGEESGPNFVRLISLLRDSSVWVTGDILQNDQVTDGAVPIYSDDTISLIPHLVSSGNNRYIPLFTNVKDSGTGTTSVSKTKMPLSEALNKAAACSPEMVQGVAINPFTSPFIIARDQFYLFFT